MPGRRKRHTFGRAGASVGARLAVKRIIGIDLGTTNCCVAAVLDGQPRVFRNRQGYATTPSV
ncbi:MAG: Hsp70 family protein, partial [Myxococcota bacterium]